MSCPGPGPSGSELRYIAAGPSTGGSGVPAFEGRCSPCYESIGQTIQGEILKDPIRRVMGSGVPEFERRFPPYYESIGKF